MAVPRIERLDLPRRSDASPTGTRLWREWCFIRVAFRHFRLRFLLMAGILCLGTTLFLIFEPEKDHSFSRALYYTWALAFGEAPEDFPRSGVLGVLFFVVPVLGLTVIIEGIIDFALMLRDRRRYERSWCTMLASSYSNHIVLVGFGKLGYRTFILLRKLGEPVVVIEREADCQFLEDLRRDGSPVLIGDARRESLLNDANIRKARSIVLATDDDMANLEIALDAQRLAPGIRVVMRLFDQNMADKLSDGFDIHLAVSQSALSAPTFAISAVAPAIVSCFLVGNQLVVMQRWLVRQHGPLTGRTIAEIMKDHGVGVVEHRGPGGEPRVFPPPDTRLEPGDGLVLQGPLNTLSELWKRNTEELGKKTSAAAS